MERQKLNNALQLSAVEVIVTDGPEMMRERLIELYDIDIEMVGEFGEKLANDAIEFVASNPNTLQQCLEAGPTVMHQTAAASKIAMTLIAQRAFLSGYFYAKEQADGSTD